MIRPRLPVTVLPPASADLIHVKRWYERQAQGLGRVFWSEVKRQIHHIGQFPEAYPFVDAPCRRATLRRFPYAIWYRILPEVIEIVAVFDTRSDPHRIVRRATTLPD